MEDMMKNTVILNNGVEMPQIGYGVYQIPSSIDSSLKALGFDHIERMKENLDILDFELTQEEMDVLSGLDLDRSMFGWW